MPLVLIRSTSFKFPTTIKIEAMIIKNQPHKTFKLILPPNLQLHISPNSLLIITTIIYQLPPPPPNSSNTNNNKTPTINPSVDNNKTRTLSNFCCLFCFLLKLGNRTQTYTFKQ